jgi:hypothetical protein
MKPPRAIQVEVRSGGWTDYARRRRDAFFLLYARDFFRASLKTGSLLVRAHLFGHALELMFKTYLLSSGLGERAIKKRGHNLRRLLADCQANDIGKMIRVSPQIQSAIGRFSVVYETEAFRYFSILYLIAPPQLPDLRPLVRFARVLERRLIAWVRGSVTKA